MNKRKTSRFPFNLEMVVGDSGKNGQGLLEGLGNIDMVDVVVSGAENVVTGGGSNARKLALSVTSEVIQATADVEIDGDVNLDTSVENISAGTTSALAGKVYGKAAEATTGTVKNFGLDEQIKNSKLRAKGAQSHSKRQKYEQERGPRLEERKKRNLKNAAVVGHVTGELVEERTNQYETDKSSFYHYYHNNTVVEENK